jgi:hypothetical protein
VEDANPEPASVVRQIRGPLFLQYHNVAKLGWVPLDGTPFLQTRLSIATRKPAAHQAVGGTVFVVASLGRPRRYYLWESFVAEGVERDGDDLCVWGTGRQLVPPAPLVGEDFDAFREACAYFIGFRRIDGLPYAATLAALAQSASSQITAAADEFCTRLIAQLPDSPDTYFYRGFVRHHLGQNLDAISDLAEALRRGTEFADEARATLRLAAARI